MRITQDFSRCDINTYVNLTPDFKKKNFLYALDRARFVPDYTNVLFACISKG